MPTKDVLWPAGKNFLVDLQRNTRGRQLSGTQLFCGYIGNSDLVKQRNHLIIGRRLIDGSKEYKHTIHLLYFHISVSNSRRPKFASTSTAPPRSFEHTRNPRLLFASNRIMNSLRSTRKIKTRIQYQSLGARQKSFKGQSTERLFELTFKAFAE